MPAGRKRRLRKRPRWLLFPVSEAEVLCGRHAKQFIAPDRGRFADNFPEHAVELRERLKAGFVGRLADALMRILEQVLNLLVPHATQIVGEGEASGSPVTSVKAFS